MAHGIGPRPCSPVEPRNKAGHIGSFKNEIASRAETTATGQQEAEWIWHMLNHMPAHKQIECVRTDKGRVFQFSGEDIQLQLVACPGRRFFRKFDSCNFPAAITGYIHEFSPRTTDFEHFAPRHKVFQPCDLTVAATGD